MKRKYNMNLVVGIGAIVLAAIGLALFMVKSQPEKVVLVVPTADIPAYREITPNQLSEVRVNADEALGVFLTAQEVNDLRKGDTTLYSVAPLAAQTPILDASVNNDPNRSMQIVSSDEVLVGVVTNLPGALIGTVTPGRVVDVLPTGGSSSTVSPVTYAKVVAIGDKSAADGLAGATKPVQGEGEAKDNGILVILSVARDDAATIAGQDVSMTLHPFCSVNNDGAIVPTSDDKADACAVPAGRNAGKTTATDAE